MYTIYYDDNIVYDPYSPEQNAFNVSCNGGINDKGTMRFSVAANHILYNRFQIRKGLIRFEHDGNIIFIGYIDSITKNFNLELDISCVGELACLGDVLVKPYATFTNNEGMEYVHSDPESLLRFYMDTYNAKASYPLGLGDFEFGNLTTENFLRYNSSVSTVAKELETQFLDTLGGYVYISHDESGSYLNYYQDVGGVNAQIIDFGVNLMDYTYTTSSSELYTAIYAEGSNGITIKDASNEERHRTYEQDCDIDDDLVIFPEGIEKYGYRAFHYSYNDAETADELLAAATAKLKMISTPTPMVIVKAIDLSLYMSRYTHLKVGEIARVRSYPHGIDEYMVVTEIDVDLDNPENTEYTLGIVYDTLTGEQSSKLQELNSSLDRATDRVDNLAQEVVDVAQDAAQTKDELLGLKDRFESSEFERSEFEEQVNNSMKQIRDLVDGTIMTWFYPYAPSVYNEPASLWESEAEKKEHLGDLFYDTETGYAYRWMQEPNVDGELRYSWGRIIDTDVQAALKVASQAKDTADSKRRVFYETPYPPYDEGDLWAQGYGGDILMSKVDRPSGSFNPNDWVYAAKYNKAVFNTEEWFYQSDSPTELTGGSWSSENTWIEGKYTWRRTLVIYGDGTQEWQPSEQGICITGNTGDTGVGVLSVDVWYYLSRSSTEPIGSVWVTDAPQWVEGRFLWTKTITTYTDGREEETEPVCVAMSGSNGTSGVGVKQIEEQYYSSTSNTETVNGSWTSKYPGWQTGRYLWTRTVIYYTDGTSSQTDPVCVSGDKGQQGDKGKDGVSVLNVDVQYYLSRSATELVGSVWQTDPPGWVQGRYMWTKTIVYYSDGKKDETEPVCIALSGSNGTDGKGVIRIVEEYYRSTSNTKLEGGNWSSAYPGAKEGTYIWTRSTIYYTDGSNESTVPICVTGPKGEDGEDGKDGVGVESVVVYYLLTNRSTGVTVADTGWVTEPPTMTETNRYLWSYTKTTYTNGKYDSTKPVVVGVYGLSGKDGEDGTAISGTCNSTADANPKIVKTTQSFPLKEGVCISVYFNYGNTASEPKLKVNDLDPINVMTNGVNEGYWQDNNTVLFVLVKEGQSYFWYVASHPVWGTKATIGNPGKNNIYLDGTNLDFRTGSTVNSTFTNGTIELGKNSNSSIIKMCGNKGFIDYSNTGVSTNSKDSINIYTANRENGVHLQAGPLRAAGKDSGSYLDVATNSIAASVVDSNGYYRTSLGIDATSARLNGNGSYISTSSNSNTIYCSEGPNNFYAYSSQYYVGRNIFWTGGIYKGDVDTPVYGGQVIFSGSSNGQINLYSYPSNFAMIEIFYTDNVGSDNSVKVNSGYSSYIVADLLTTRYDSSSLYFNHRQVVINGWTLDTLVSSSITRYGRFMIKSGQTSYWNTNNIYVTQVIGWK